MIYEVDAKNHCIIYEILCNANSEEDIAVFQCLKIPYKIGWCKIMIPHLLGLNYCVWFKDQAHFELLASIFDMFEAQKKDVINGEIIPFILPEIKDLVKVMTL